MAAIRPNTEYLLGRKNEDEWKKKMHPLAKGFLLYLLRMSVTGLHFTRCWQRRWFGSSPWCSVTHGVRSVEESKGKRNHELLFVSHMFWHVSQWVAQTPHNTYIHIFFLLQTDFSHITYSDHGFPSPIFSQILPPILLTQIYTFSFLSLGNKEETKNKPTE